MPKPSSSALAVLGACLFHIHAVAQVAVLPGAPEVGPPSISIGHETRNAMVRAEAWLKKNPLPEPICQCLAKNDEICQCLANPETAENSNAEPICQALANRSEMSAAEVEALIPLLVAQPSESMDYFLFARLAKSLHARGQETVFLPDGRALPWRASLLQQLVMTQRIAADGTAYWVGADDSAEGIRAATVAGLCAIRFATTP